MDDLLLIELFDLKCLEGMTTFFLALELDLGSED